MMLPICAPDTRLERPTMYNRSRDESRKHYEEIRLGHKRRGLDVLHIPRRFILVARLVAADGTHLVVIIVVFVRVFGGVLIGVLLYIFCYRVSPFLSCHGRISSMYP